MSYPKRPPTIASVKEVLTDGPVRLRFTDDTKTTLLDSFTASAIVACYNALSDENKAKIDKLILTKAGFFRFVNFCWKHVKTT